MKIYTRNISGLQDPDAFAKGMEALPEFRREIVNRMKVDSAKHQSMGAWLLLMDALKEEGLSEEKVRNLTVAYGPSGKPILKDCEDLHFNLSHSGEWVMCVIADRPVGCDVEKISGSVNTMEKVARRGFSDAEYAYYREAPEQEGLERFYRIWTRKESLMKATGLGFRLPTEAFSVVPAVDVEQVRGMIPEGEFRFEEYVKDGYAFCACERMGHQN